MCVNYLPASRYAIGKMFGIADPEEDERLKPEVWQDYLAPIVVRPDDAPAYSAVASYGFIPQNRKPPGVTRLSTMNARSESIGELRSYKRFWAASQLCLIPMTGFFEPNYETGSAVRWRIGMADGSPFAVAGMWRTWQREDGGQDCSFTQITLNADDHPLLRRFHKPDDEKRTLAIISPDDYDAWLTCRDPELARTFLRHYPAERMAAGAAPVVRKSRTG